MADVLDLDSSGKPYRFESCHPHHSRKFVKSFAVKLSVVLLSGAFERKFGRSNNGGVDEMDKVTTLSRWSLRVQVPLPSPHRSYAGTASCCALGFGFATSCRREHAYNACTLCDIVSLLWNVIRGSQLPTACDALVERRRQVLGAVRRTPVMFLKQKSANHYGVAKWSC